MEASHKKLQEAYFNLGKTYMNDLNNPEKAIESFQNLNEKYPENPFKLSAYYFLYKIFRNTDNTDLSERYKNKILSEFPQSNHAKVITNPDYFRELEQQKNQAEKLYAQTLEAYHNKNYNKVLNNCQKALEKFDNKAYRSKFRYLETLIIGRTQDIISFRDNLQEIAESYSDTEIGLQAKDILAYLKKTELHQINQRFVQNKPGTENQDSLSQNPEQETDQKSNPNRVRRLMRYQFEADVPYYFVTIANPKRIDIGRLKFELINFNLDYFLQKDYTTTSDQFNEFYSIITVKKFDDYSTAKNYYDLVKKREDRIFSEFSSKEYRYFYISLKNYLTLLEMKSIIEYINFFKIEVNQKSEEKDEQANNAS
jgi:TolA-binding protein